MSEIPSILVYGATGPQGRVVAERLLDAGLRVRVLARDPARAAALAKRGAEVVQGDYADPASLDAASRGVDGVFLVVPFLAAQLGAAPAVAKAAKAAGVRLVVWNTTGPVPGAPTGNPGADARLETRTALEASGLPHVTLEPSIYMENFLGPWTAPEVAERSVFAYPLPEGASIQPIAQADVATYAVEAFRRPDLAGSRFALCGPEALDGPAIAERVSAGLGRPVRFRSMPPEEFGSVLDRLFGPGAGEAATAFYRAAFANPALISTAIDPSPALAALPIAPTSLQAWARQHASIFSATGA